MKKPKRFRQSAVCPAAVLMLLFSLSGCSSSQTAAEIHSQQPEKNEETDSGYEDSEMLSSAEKLDGKAGLLCEFARQSGFGRISEEELLFDQKTGRQVETKEDTDSYVISYLRSSRDSQPEIRIYDDQDQLKTGQFSFHQAIYYADPETGVLQTGYQKVPWRQIPDDEIEIYASEIVDRTFGIFQIGRIDFEQENGKVHSRFFLPTGALVKNAFLSTNEGVIFCDENGWIVRGEVSQDGHLYKTDENGIIETMDGRTFTLFSENEKEGTVSLWLRGKELQAEQGTVNAEILEKSAGPAEYAQYVSGGRDSSRELDCIGYALYAMNQVLGTDYEAKSVNAFAKDTAAARQVDEKKAQPGDLVLFRGTYLPKSDHYTHYTHAAVYMGDGMVLSMGYDGLSYEPVESIVDYYGNPAPHEYYRLNRKTETEE